MDTGSRRTSEARLAAEALLNHSGTVSSSMTAINYGLSCLLYRTVSTLLPAVKILKH